MQNRKIASQKTTENRLNKEKITKTGKTINFS